MATRVRDKSGRSLSAVLTRQEFKRLDALFQAKALVNEMAQGQRMLDKFVASARENGATWAEIATATGMSAQAAHKHWSIMSKRTPPIARVRKPRVPVKREVQESLLV
jgi:hypothetical protein